MSVCVAILVEFEALDEIGMSGDADVDVLGLLYPALGKTACGEMRGISSLKGKRTQNPQDRDWAF